MPFIASATSTQTEYRVEILQMTPAGGLKIIYRDADDVRWEVIIPVVGNKKKVKR